MREAALIYIIQKAMNAASKQSKNQIPDTDFSSLTFSELLIPYGQTLLNTRCYLELARTRHTGESRGS